MVHPQNDPYGKPVPGPRGLPGMRPELVRIHHAIAKAGATTSGSARPLQDLSRRTGFSKNTLQDALRTLEGKGVASHQTAGHDTLWHVTR